MQYIIYIGLDLSYTCTGVTIYNTEQKILNFYRVFGDTPPKKKRKNEYIFEKVCDVYAFDTQYYTQYPMWCDSYTKKEIQKSDFAFLIAHKIQELLKNYIDTHKVETTKTQIVITYEGHLMPNIVTGTQQYAGLSQLIGLQYIIRANLKHFFTVVLQTPPTNLVQCVVTPSENKAIFTGLGTATKQEMIYTFLHDFNGFVLLGISDKHPQNYMSLNDVVDSFALVVSTLYKRHVLNPQEQQEKEQKKQQKQKQKRDKQREQTQRRKEQAHNVSILINSLQ